MDADTTLAPQFVQTALRRFRGDRGVAAVEGIFSGPPPSGMLETAQGNEFARYGREVARTGRVMVLSGTATAFQRSTIDAVRAARGVRLPGRPGDLYDVGALTEDNEVTLAVKTLGLRIVSPRKCVALTELIPTVGTLHRQRLRWYRGAVENLFAYGFTKATRRYWYQHGMLHAATIGGLSWSPWWLTIGGIFWAHKVVTAWPTGPNRRSIAAVMLPELAYNLFLQVTFIRVLTQAARCRKAPWHHDTSITPQGA